jgi:hypothetical protein
VVHACYVTKGKQKGTIRVVPRAASCKQRHGQRAIAWSMAGPNGTKGAAGPEGETSEPGEQGTNGVAGVTGPAGQVEKSVLETIQTQTSVINELTKEVTSLETSLTGVEGTLEGACTQLSAVTKQTGLVEGVVENLSLTGVLGGLLNIPALPTPLGTFACP